MVSVALAMLCSHNILVISICLYICSIIKQCTLADLQLVCKKNTISES